MTATPVNQPLPKYAKPPVVEVALSVQFEQLDLTAAHLGLVWELFRDRFPKIQEKSELAPEIERFAPAERRVPGVRFKIESVPATRFWFVSDSGDELVQVQRDRFIRNWRKTEDSPEYPSYSTLCKKFKKDWYKFAKFVTEECSLTLVPNQCELTYVNIVEDVDSNHFANVFTWVNGSYSDGYLSNVEEAELILRYVLQNEPDEPWGRLHISTEPALTLDGKPAVRLALTARGEPKTQDFDGIRGFLDKGHEAIVRGFTSITTVEMHKIWEREV